MSPVDMAVALVGGLGSSLLLTASAFAIGALIGLPVAGARGSRSRILRLVGTAYIEIARGIPPIAWLFLLFFGLTQFGVRMMNMTAAILGLGIIAGAYMAEIYRSSVAALPSGQYEASRALALSRTTAFFSVVLPQAVVTGLPQAVSFAIGLLKDSAIASVIGVSGVTTIALMLSRRSLDALTIFLICGLVYMVISVPTSFFGRWLGSRLALRMGMAR